MKRAEAPIDDETVPRTVVHFIDTDTFGGAERAVLILLAGLDRKRWRPILFHHDVPGAARLLMEAAKIGVPCQRVPRITRRNMATGLWAFARALREARPAIFHVHLNWPLACRHAVVAARISR